MKIQKLSIFLILIVFSGLYINAQVITIDPAFPTANEPATVYFNAIGTALEGYEGDVYAHTGLITDQSSSSSDWKYVISGWDVNIEKAKLINLEANLYKLDLDPTIRSFYEAPNGEEILQLAFVFRSSDSQLQTSPDIFYDVYEPELAVIITLPEISPLIVQMDDIVTVEWATLMADSSFLYIGDQMVFADTGSSFSYDIVISDFEKKWVTAVAKNGTDSVSDSFYYYVRGDVVEEELPEDIRDGITYSSETSAVLCLYAPEKEYVFAWGDYSDWELSDDVYMKRTPDGNRYWVELTGLVPRQQYVFQYLIDGEIRVGDMYCEQVSDPWNDSYISSATYPGLPEYPNEKTFGIASVLQTDQAAYEWQNEDFTPPKKTDLVVYELLVRDFTEAHDFQTLIDTIDYLERLGVNAIELMPTNEFEGNSSWGYNPNYYFATDKYYGHRNTFKAFVDECHSRGIAVFIDLVLNHAYGTCPFVMMYWDSENNRPAENNPWFNQESNFENPDAQWGYDFNHESPQTQVLIDSINSYWMSEYKIDGFRFDFTKGFSNTPHGADDEWGSKYDPDRVAILKRMSDEIWKRKADAVVIFEHLSENSEEKVLADYGIMLWGKMTSEYNEGTMGYNENGKSDLYWGYYGHRGWNEPNLVTYMESHDEERLMYKNITYGNSGTDYDVTDLATALKRQELAANFFYTIPGPKMIWQFGERGYDISIDYNGRVGEKPPKWEYMEDFNRRNLYYVNQALINLKIEEDVFETTDFSGDGRYAKKWYWLKSDEMDVIVLGNFDLKEAVFAADINPIGTWYEFWTGDTLVVTSTSEPITLQAGEYRLYSSKKLDTPDFVSINETIDDDGVSSFIIYPNPATTKLNVVIENDGRHKNVDIILYDMLGKKLKNMSDLHINKGLSQLEIDVQGINPGVYFVQFDMGSEAIVEKLIIR